VNGDPAQDIKPLPVDPQVMARIRPMQRSDLPGVVRLHSAAMGNSLWARLGRRFLHRVYRGLLRHPDFLGFVYVGEGRVQGFIAGTTDGPRMTRDVLLRNARSLAVATAEGVLRDPTAALPLLQTFGYHAQSTPDVGGDIAAESVFCSFEPSQRGKRISGLINKVLFDELAARGHRHVKITTEHDNRGAVRQLTSWGFERVGSFHFYGKEMLVWRLDLVASPRVDSP